MANDLTRIVPGYFSKIDSIHVHVDGGGAIAPVEFIVEQLKKEGSLGKTTPIIDVVAGPQREEDWAVGTYESHTPGPIGQEQLEFFSTTLLSNDLRNMRGAIQKLNQILSILFDQQTNMPQGIVVEVERVIGKGEDEIQWSEIPVEESFVIHSPDAGFDRHRTAEIEIHYAFDIPKAGRWENVPPLRLIDLANACVKLGIWVGGWFFFDKGDRWAYRSNQFTRVGLETIAQEQRDKLDEYLTRTGKQLEFECKARTLIEQILGVWRTPLRPVDTLWRKSVRQLAEWEENPELDEFWVIAPNFLGDKRGDVRQAMVRNLRSRVRYTYFLRSFADIQRLRKLAKTLEPDVRGFADVFKLIKAVLLESIPGSARDVFDEECFIANPHSESREGYRLLRTGKGEIYAGERMRSSDFQKADLLATLLKQNQIAHWMQITIRRDSVRSNQKAIICTKINRISDHGMTLNEQDWEIVISEFDQIVADIVSRLCGQVIKGPISSYFIIFDDAEQSLICAAQLQASIRDYNKRINLVDIPLPRIALDFGLIMQVMRSYGFDFIGQPLSVCAKLVEQVSDGEILLTKVVEDNLRPLVKNQFRISNIGARAIEEFGNVECKKLDWE